MIPDLPKNPFDALRFCFLLVSLVFFSLSLCVFLYSYLKNNFKFPSFGIFKKISDVIKGKMQKLNISASAILAIQVFGIYGIALFVIYLFLHLVKFFI